MGTQKLFSIFNLKTYSSFVNYGSLKGWVSIEMMRFGCFVWGLVYGFLLFLFGYLDRFLERLEADENPEIREFSTSINENSLGKGKILKHDWPRKREEFEVLSGNLFEETKKSISEEKFSPVANTCKYEISSAKHFCGYVEEPKGFSFVVEEMFSECKDDFAMVKNGNEENRRSVAYLESGFQENYLEQEKVLDVENDQGTDQVVDSDDIRDVNLEKEDSVQVYSEESDSGNLRKVISDENGLQEEKETETSGSGFCELRFSFSSLELEPRDHTEEETTKDSVQVSSTETNLGNEDKVISSENSFFEENEDEKNDSGEFHFSFMNSELVSKDPIKGNSIMSPKVHPILNDDEKMDFSKDLDVENGDEFIELDPSLQISTNKASENGNISEKAENIYDLEDEEEDDILLQHHENIEKMKMEMRSFKMKGLPTILENCESFKIGEDLKPLKIDEKKMEYKDRVEEIQKVYKSYFEKMKKLDILNYQTLNAINFMQLKDPTQQKLGQKSLNSGMKSIWPSKLRRIHADPTLKSIFEMHKNLETVYVGQLCLSWETLRWEYEKAKKLLEYDHEGLRSYNLVAGEFQQFQVLVQRFVENEQFLGGRVQNYAKNRCELRVFLQVPVIKEDCLKEKRECSNEGENEISISMLSDIIDETMRVFWDFVRADHRDDKFPNLKGLSPNHVDFQDPSDSKLFSEIKTNLQMKEKRLKDILRTGNCIVKKFQKQPEGRTDLDLLFAQIDLKLVSRVLNMSKLTTDQLIWSQNKLHKVKFRSRKVHVEPSFLLFPF